ncbi:DNA polymerase III subunit delta' [Corynebacterium sp. HMSC036D03]|uniref:DNA polymerase III subunit delta' n=1 Tax=Corynebacterium sp. HMSC036D03 TaxID=1715171 RepID=UPI0009F2B8BB|nr:DNA polymerase III subunit delta' [Corynebacterium sp. HMSC036D03]
MVYYFSYPSRLGRVNTGSVAQRLADTPAVAQTILAAARAARGEGDLRAMSHSWLLTGPPGAGRSLAALCFAAALMCTSKDENGDPGCGQCAACRAVLEQQKHTDLVFVDPKEQFITVGEARDVIGRAASLPSVAPWRVVIFNKADRLRNEAANALLKTVEEPPERTVIVMVAPSADPQDFSQTLRSRCRHLYIPSPSVEGVVKQLVAEGASEHDARLAAVTSLQHVGRARHLVQDAGVQKRRAMAINLAEDVFHGSQAFQSVTALLKFIEKDAKDSHAESEEAERSKIEQSFGIGAKGKGASKAQRDARSALKELEELHKKRAKRRIADGLDIVLVDLAGIYRDALMLKVGAEVDMTHPDFAGLAGELAQCVSEDGLLAAQSAIRTCREQLPQNVTPQVAFDGMIGRLRLACGAR